VCLYAINTSGSAEGLVFNIRESCGRCLAAEGKKEYTVQTLAAFSKKLDSTQPRYSTFDRELLATWRASFSQASRGEEIPHLA
jgi:hypothetical protein